MYFCSPPPLYDSLFWSLFTCIAFARLTPTLVEKTTKSEPRSPKDKTPPPDALAPGGGRARPIHFCINAKI